MGVSVSEHESSNWSRCGQRGVGMSELGVKEYRALAAVYSVYIRYRKEWKFIITIGVGELPNYYRSV